MLKRTVNVYVEFDLGNNIPDVTLEKLFYNM